MINQIIVNGTQEFMGKTIPVLEGGFSENCRIISAKEIANIHDMRLADLNASIKRLIKRRRIKEGVDYLDLLSETVSLKDFAKENGLIGSNKTSVVFVLSERGYTKLIKSMDDDQSWDVMDKLVDEYFTMRKIIQENRPSYLIEDSIERALAWIEEEKQRRKLLEDNKLLIANNEELSFENQQLNFINSEQSVELDLHKRAIDVDELSILQKQELIKSVVSTYSNKNYKQRWTLLYSTLKTEYGINIYTVKTEYDAVNTPKSKSLLDAAIKAGYVNELFDCMCQLWFFTIQEKLQELYGLTLNSSYYDYSDDITD